MRLPVLVSAAFAALVVSTAPVDALADVPNDDCGEVDDECSTFEGESGTCKEAEDGSVFCDTSDDGGCQMRSGRAALSLSAAVALSLAAAFALRRARRAPPEREG